MNFAGETPAWWRAFFDARRDLEHGLNSLSALEHGAQTKRGRDKAHRAYLDAYRRRKAA